jgi:hypothetical protein
MNRTPAHTFLVWVFLVAVAMFAFLRTGAAQTHHSNSHVVQPTTRADDVDAQTQRLLTDIEDAGRTTTTGPADAVSHGPEMGADRGLLRHLREVYGPTLSVAWPSVLVALGLACAGGILGVFVVLRRDVGGGGGCSTWLAAASAGTGRSWNGVGPYGLVTSQERGERGHACSVRGRCVPVHPCYRQRGRAPDGGAEPFHGH